MSSTNKTAELHLSQFIGTDIPSILTDYNGDMQKIDAGVREVKQATAGAVSDLSSVTARVTNAEQDISGLNSTVQGIATRVVTAEGEIDALQTSVANKADTSTVSALATQVAGKADAGVVDALGVRVTNAEGSIAQNSQEINDVDDAVATIEAHRYRKLYNSNPNNTVLQDAQAIWSAFLEQLVTTSLDSIINNLLSLVLYDGRHFFRFDGLGDGGSDLLTFTAHLGFGQSFTMYSINLRLSASLSTTNNPTVISVTGGKIEFDVTNHTLDDYTINKLSAYVIGGTYAPRHI